MPFHNRIAADGNNRIAADANNRITPEEYAVAVGGDFALDVDVAGWSLDTDMGGYLLDVEISGRERSTS